jgi:DNA-binding transcriptional LysR family regulator
MNNKLNAIATFLRVVEAGSFSAAARQCGMKQSAVSQQIAALEEELGVVLLHRTTRGDGADRAGESYRRDMQLLLEAMHEAERRLHPTDRQWQGRVHVQLPSGLGQLFCRICWRCRKCTPTASDAFLDDRIADLVAEGWMSRCG